MNLSPEVLEAARLRDPAAYERLLELLDEYEVASAREDYNAFCKYVLRDEQTGGPLSWAPYHEDYLRFLDEAEASVVFGHVEMGKTQLGIGYLLWRLGRNPNLRILLLNAKASISQRTASTMRMHIQNNERLHKVFPELRPATPWTDEEFCVQRRAGITTPTVVASGVDSSIISFRFDIVWGDDVVNNENTQTAYLRQKTLTWFQNSPMSRTSRNMKVMITVNRWHPTDAAHMLSKLPGWKTRVYPVGRKRMDGSIQSYWPAHWPVTRINKEISKRTPAEGDRAFFCIAYSESSSRVQHAWFVDALHRGRGIGGEACTNLVNGIQLRPGELGVVGVDLGLSDSARSDLTALTFMGLKVPEGGFEISNVGDVAKAGLLRGPDVTVYGFISGRMLVDAVFEQVVLSHRAFNRAPIIFVESVQAQRWLVDIIGKTHPHIQIFPFLTRGRGTRANKNHKVYGVEGWFRALATNEVSLLCAGDGEMSSDMAEFTDECMNYSPEAHTGDRLMSAWIGYTGGLTYMLDNQIGSVGVEELYTEGRTAVTLEGPITVEEAQQVHDELRRVKQEYDRGIVRHTLDTLLLEHQMGATDVRGIGSFG